MKSIKLMLALILIAATSFAQKTANLQVEPFSKIKLSSIATVYVRIDPVQTVKVVGSIVNSDEVNVKNQTLYIDNSTGNTYFITVPSLEEVELDGKGDVYSESTITGSNISLKIDGAGKIKMDLDVTNIKATVPGAGKIELTGKGDVAEFSVPGSGKIDADGLKLRKADASISGIGKISVDATDELNSTISGSGTITYKTLPAKLNEDVSGIGHVKSSNSVSDANSDTTRISLGKSQLWVIGKADSTKSKTRKTKPIWAGIELGVNSYLDNKGDFNLADGKENFELKLNKSVSFSLNFLQKNVQLGHSNVWFFTGLGVTWNNYRFDDDIKLSNGNFTNAYHDTTAGVSHQKSKLVASYLTAPIMFEFFTSRKYKNAFHMGVGGTVGLLIGSHTKNKVEIDGETKKLKDFGDFNLNPFRYGFRVAMGYGRLNVFADYYASTLFKDKKGPVLYPVNVGITLVGL